MDTIIICFLILFIKVSNGLRHRPRGIAEWDRELAFQAAA